MRVDLSNEQKLFIEKAKEGRNILVDACIGSGKTTAIQHLCDELPSTKKILYLTYNKLLKLDAKSKIKNKNVRVTNYHGFAYYVFKKMNISVGMLDLIQRFNIMKPALDKYDILIIDEYQDIELDLSKLLSHIKSANNGMQIIAVGDMEQKIYDKTTLSVPEFMEQFLENPIKLEFTQCFRLSAGLAEKLGRIWNKNIVGVNKNCIIEEMDFENAAEFLSKESPKDILCLGARTGDLSKMLNRLEQEYPNQFNKKTVFATISDKDADGAVKPKSTSAIFTTYDGSKGLERKICAIFDFDDSYWQIRVKKPQTSQKILRNLFCVAASRGKERIIFVNSGESILSEETLSMEINNNSKFEDMGISKMFDFKYKEHIEECYSLLSIEPLNSQEDLSEIKISGTDGLIDLSPCIGMYQEAVFFENYNIDRAIESWLELNKDKKYLYSAEDRKSTIDRKILILTSLETSQDRYRNQIELPFVNASKEKQIVERLSTTFVRNETVQTRCSIDFSDEKDGKLLFSAKGVTDVVKNNIVYELKFVSELAHEHFLQCACYIVALGVQKGILWNTRKNEKYEITIPDKNRFLDAITKTITKGYLEKYNAPMRRDVDVFTTDH